MSRVVPAVTLELESRPESLILVRGMLVGVADVVGLDGELLHGLKTVVSEACNNVVLHAYDRSAPGPVAISLEILPDGVEAIVRDWGCGIRHIAPSEDRIHVGLAVISALADRVQFLHARDGGTEVRMAFTGRHGIRALRSSSGAELSAYEGMGLSGDAVATVSPVGLLEGVLARLATGLAARARFSLDRFCDVYLVSDAIAAHAEHFAAFEHLEFAIAAGERRLELTIGPFRAGSGDEVGCDEEAGPLGSALSMLAIEVAVEPVAGAEMWRMVVLDGEGGPSSADPDDDDGDVVGRRSH